MPDHNTAAILDGEDLLRSPPLALIEPEKKLIVLWSPKSACTAVYVWFSHLAGFSGEVEAHARVVHAHRGNVYLQSRRYRDALKSDTRSFHVLRIIRDPHDRAVSIFRHALTRRFADPLVATAGLNFWKGVSFCQFLEFLAVQDVSKADVHLRPQLHPYERHRKPDTVINITKRDMFEELNAFERRMGWPVTDFPAIHWLHERESARKTRSETFPGDNIDELPLVRVLPVRSISFPLYYQLLTPRTKTLIREIYAADFDAYREYL